MKYKILPSYVGSKSYWINKLGRYRNRRFIELFAGSAVLSMNLAKSAILNDSDPYVYKIIKDFDQQIVPEVFTKNQYFEVRKQEDWWRYSFCLQKMSFSGVFRYSKNGYNVPVKDIESISVKDDYDQSLRRWRVINPEVYNVNYMDLTEKIYDNYDSVLILDPPYENSNASYVDGLFDYHIYWEWVRLNWNVCKNIVIFDHVENLPFAPIDVKKNRVNGSKKGNMEGCFEFGECYSNGYDGEKIIAYVFKNILVHIDEPHKPDFYHKEYDLYLELKTDFYDHDRTENFFIERYSDKRKRTPGGPWQALEKKCACYMYFFKKNNLLYIMDLDKIIKILESIVDKFSLVDIPNKNFVTSGYKIPRTMLNDAIMHKVDIEPLLKKKELSLFD